MKVKIAAAMIYLIIGLCLILWEFMLNEPEAALLPGWLLFIYCFPASLPLSYMGSFLFKNLVSPIKDSVGLHLRFYKVR